MGWISLLLTYIGVVAVFVLGMLDVVDSLLLAWSMMMSLVVGSYARSVYETELGSILPVGCVLVGWVSHWLT